jgi:hypothetical protein
VYHQFALGLLLLSGSSALAQVPPDIHRLCIDAKDYSGCVKAQQEGGVDRVSSPNRLIMHEGAPIVEGNSCPASYAYRGGGICQEVKCTYDDGNDPMLGGKNHKCGNASFWSGYIGRMTLRWGSATVRAFDDPNCPPGQPEVGWTSTCNTAPPDWRQKLAERQEKQRPICLQPVDQYGCSYSAYLNANPQVKAWAESHPQMAEKERLRLRAEQ